MKENIVKTKLSVYFEIFDTANENEYVTDFPTLEEAISYAEEANNNGKYYAVDMVMDLMDYNTEESLPTSGDYLYTMQVYPQVKQYNNHDMEPKLFITEGDDNE